MNTKKLSTDTLFTTLSFLFYNVVLQFAVYPFINANVGEAAFGKIIYLLSFVSIFSVSIGFSVNNETLIFNSKNQASLKDGIKTILCLVFVFIFAFFLYGIFTKESILTLLPCCILIFFTTFRYYAEVFFKAQKNFISYFIYYILLCIGYLLGLFIFYKTRKYYLLFLTGEILPLIYIFIIRLKVNTQIFKLDITNYEKNTSSIFFKEACILTFSSLIYNFSLNLDRILLHTLQNELAVTQYYTASLIGKTVALLIAPINIMIITHGINYFKNISVSKYIKTFSIVVFSSAIIYVCICVCSPIFVKIFYPTVFDSVKNLIAIISLGQVLLFASSVLLSILLIIATSKWQIIIQSLYAILYFIAMMILIRKHGILGAGEATIIAGVFKFVLVIIISLLKIRNQHKHILKVPKAID